PHSRPSSRSRALLEAGCALSAFAAALTLTVVLALARVLVGVLAAALALAVVLTLAIVLGRRHRRAARRGGRARRARSSAFLLVATGERSDEDARNGRGQKDV